MKRTIIKPDEERRMQRGHPRVCRGEIETVLGGYGQTEAELEPGACADVESSPFYPGGTKRPRPQFLGKAIVNPESRIVACVYSSSKEGFDKGFFKRRIREALEEVFSSPLRPGKAALSMPDGIVEKSDPVRELEGPPLFDGLIRGSFPAEGAVIAENGLLYD